MSAVYRRQADLVWAARSWRTNGEMIAEVARLYMTAPGTVVLDPSWGEGKWWTDFKPEHFIAHDKFKLDGVDWCALPEADDTIDVVAWDPEYISPGGRDTSTIEEFNEAYGLNVAPATPKLLHAEMLAGIHEFFRVLRPSTGKQGRFLLVKAMDYVTSGHLYDGTGNMIRSLQAVGFEYWDRFEHIGKPGPQPAHERQVHARRNLSTLIVARMPSTRRKKAILSQRQTDSRPRATR